MTVDLVDCLKDGSGRIDRGLKELKRTALEAEITWRAAREKALSRLQPDEAFLDCGHCYRVVIAQDLEGHPPRMLWRCPCSPRVSQKVVRWRSARRGEAYAS